MTPSLTVGLIAFAGGAFAIYLWNTGMQRRRYMRAYREPQRWPEDAATLLPLIEKAYRLRKGTANNLPPNATAMQLYLTLYPEHCIYDEGENKAFLNILKENKIITTEDTLTTPFNKILETSAKLSKEKHPVDTNAESQDSSTK